MKVLRENRRKRYYVELRVLGEKGLQPIPFDQIPTQILKDIAKDLNNGYNPKTSNYWVEEERQEDLED